MPVLNRLRPHAESIDGCQLRSIKHFLHLFDHVTTQLGGLPLSADYLGTMRQEPFLALSCGIAGPAHSPPTLKKAHATHRWVYSRTEALIQESAPYASLVLDDRYMVYASGWHKEIHEAFGLEDPPTPTEVFSVLHTRYVPYHRLMKKAMSMHEFCLLDYYCLGGQPTALAACYNTTPERIVWLLAQTIKTLMRCMPFALWASGSDLTPLATTRITRIYMNNIMGHGRGARIDGDICASGLYQKSMQELAELRDTNPYYRIIVTEGLRLNPIPRAFTATRWAWDTIEAKRAFEGKHWYSLFCLRERGRNRWMINKFFDKASLSLHTRIYYPPFTNEHPKGIKLRHPNTYDVYKELAELYGQGTISEDSVAGLRTKWANAFHARTGRYPGFVASRRLAGFPTQ